MTKIFEELDYRQTPIGELSLRKRRIASLGDREVLEVKLGEEYLMSSLFHEVEEALADLGIGATEGIELDVVVGGLGLGYTAAAALRYSRVRSLIVVDLLEPVIEWHQKGLVPLGKELSSDKRCRMVQADFFELALSREKGFDPESPGKKVHAVLLDIDHSPDKLLHARSGAFYEKGGLERLSHQLQPGGVFAMWSDDPPDEDFMGKLKAVFPTVESRVVTFHNPLQNKDSANTVYLAKKAK